MILDTTIIGTLGTSSIMKHSADFTDYHSLQIKPQVDIYKNAFLPANVGLLSYYVTNKYE